MWTCLHLCVHRYKNPINVYQSRKCMEQNLSRKLEHAHNSSVSLMVFLKIIKQRQAIYIYIYISFFYFGLCLICNAGNKIISVIHIPLSDS